MPSTTLCAYRVIGAPQNSLSADAIALALSQKPEWSILFDEFATLQLMKQQGVSEKLIRTHAEGLIKRIRFMQKYEADPLFEEVVLWCQKNKYSTAKQASGKNKQQSVYAGRSADELALALSERPEWSLLLEEFGVLRRLEQEGRPREVIRAHAAALLKRVRFMQKYQADPVFEEISTWCKSRAWFKPAGSATLQTAFTVCAGFFLFGIGLILWTGYSTRKARQRVAMLLQRQVLAFSTRLNARPPVSLQGPRHRYVPWIRRRQQSDPVVAAPVPWVPRNPIPPLEPWVPHQPQLEIATVPLLDEGAIQYEAFAQASTFTDTSMCLYCHQSLRFGYKNYLNTSQEDVLLPDVCVCVDDHGTVLHGAHLECINFARNSTNMGEERKCLACQLDHATHLRRFVQPRADAAACDRNVCLNCKEKLNVRSGVIFVSSDEYGRLNYAKALHYSCLAQRVRKRFYNPAEPERPHAFWEEKFKQAQIRFKKRYVALKKEHEAPAPVSSDFTQKEKLLFRMNVLTGKEKFAAAVAAADEGLTDAFFELSVMYRHGSSGAPQSEHVADFYHKKYCGKKGISQSQMLLDSEELSFAGAGAGAASGVVGRW